jgi:hypothetical protein
MNTSEFLTISTAICPERLAVIFEGNRFTFSQLNERVNRLANALAQLGVQKGDRVALLQVNGHQCVETYFAVAKTGAIYLPLNFRAKEKELSLLLLAAGLVPLGDLCEIFFKIEFSNNHLPFQIFLRSNQSMSKNSQTFCGFFVRPDSDSGHGRAFQNCYRDYDFLAESVASLSVVDCDCVSHSHFVACETHHS